MRAVLLQLLVIVLFVNSAAAKPETVKQRLRNLIRLENSLITRIASDKRASASNALPVAETALATLLDDLRKSRIKVPKAIKKDFADLLKLAKSADASVKKGLKNNTSNEALILTLQGAVEAKEGALSLLTDPANADCHVDIEFHVYTDNQNSYPRHEIFVTCNKAWNTITVTPLSAGIGDIASVWRGYNPKGKVTDLYSGGSTSCTNSLTSASCAGFLAKAGAGGSVALGIYDSTGAILHFEVDILDKDGNALDSEQGSAE